MSKTRKSSKTKRYLTYGGFYRKTYYTKTGRVDESPYNKKYMIPEKEDKKGRCIMKNETQFVMPRLWEIDGKFYQAELRSVCRDELNHDLVSIEKTLVFIEVEEGKGLDD